MRRPRSRNLVSYTQPIATSGNVRAKGSRAPTWPDAEVQQQLHFDIMVDDLDAAETANRKLRARRLAGGGENFRVFADPAGHPLCPFKR